MLVRDMKPIVWRRLMDPQHERFNESEVLAALQQGALLVQKAVLRAAPDAFRTIYKRNLTASVYRYPIPVGLLRMKFVTLDYNGTGTYAKATRAREEDIETGVFADDGDYDPRYCVNGGDISIYPTPTITVAEGMRLFCSQCVTLTDDDDDPETQGLLQPLHLAIPLYAVKLLKPEDGEDQKEIDAEIRELLSDIGDLYSGFGADSAPWQIMPEGIK